MTTNEREFLCLQCSIPDRCDESDLRCKYQQAIRRERAARLAETHAARTEKQRATFTSGELQRCKRIVNTRIQAVGEGI